MLSFYDRERWLMLSFYDREHLVGVNRRALFDADLNHAAGLRRFYLVLHLHRFDNHHSLARPNVVARLNQYADDFAGHRRRKLLPPLVAVVCLRTPVLAVDDARVVDVIADLYPDGIPLAR